MIVKVELRSCCLIVIVLFVFFLIVLFELRLCVVCIEIVCCLNL